MSKIWLLCALAGCSTAKSSTTPASAAASQESRDAALTELGLLMKNDVNPAFSKLTFLVFHGNTMEDPAQLKAELTTAATVLRGAIGRLRTWTQPPTESTEGRDVFYTYANAVDASTERLVGAIDRDDQPTAAAQMRQIAKTCNSCHHFFRLQIEDSVVP